MASSREVIYNMGLPHSSAVQIVITVRLRHGCLFFCLSLPSRSPPGPTTCFFYFFLRQNSSFLRKNHWMWFRSGSFSFAALSLLPAAGVTT